MKTIEKMILCCIWICIAIVFVLIRDQMILNEKRRTHVNRQEIDVPEIVLDHQVILSEEEIMELVSEKMPVMKEAKLEFQSDGVIRVSLDVDDELIHQAQTMIDSDLISSLVPLLKGTEIACEATLDVSALNLTECKAGLVSLPKELLSIVEEKMNETWSSIVSHQGIENVDVSSGGIRITMSED